MLAFLANLGIGTIVSRLASAYEAREKAKTDTERILADTRIAQLQARAAVQTAEARWPINGIIRLLFAFPVAVYYGKIFLWDKALGLGAPDALTDDLTWTARVIIVFYFLFEGAQAMRRSR